MKKIVFLLITIYSLPLNAQLSDWEYGGYIKNLATYSEVYNTFGLNEEPGNYQNVLQGRLNVDWYPSYDLNFTAQSRHVFIYQKNYELIEDLYKGLSRNSYYFDLTWEAIQEKDYQLFSELDRLYARWYAGNLEVTLGRQRIAWGTCLVWNPTDLFNAASVLDFDYPEKPGTDAIKMQYYLDELSGFELAFSPGKTSQEVIYALRYKTNFWSYDFSLLAGKQLNTLRLGGSWAGDILEGGFRGEFVYSKPDIKLNTPYPLIPRIEIENAYWTVALSYDYTFDNSLYLHTEWLYNELGVTENSGYRRLVTVYSGELSPSRHSVFFEVAYDITPLIRSNLFVIKNPSDGSWIAAPSMTYSLATNWEAYVLAFPSEGKTGSEFGGYPAQYFLRIQYSF